MLLITVPSVELFDEKKNEFVPVIKEQDLQLEHSLISLSRWESKWCKPFLSKTQKTKEETIDYIKCMTLTQNVNPKVYDNLTVENYKEINNYIEAKMTAINFREDKSGRGLGEQITAELIYYWMFELKIPIECQKWHLARLFNQIRFCNLKNQPVKKRKQRDIMSRNAALNNARKQQWNTSG